jgi:DNA repair exonuclease SbcCD ATPase subunit
MLQEALLEIDSSFEAKQIIVLENKLEEFDKKIAELKTEFMQYENTKKFIQKQIKQLESGVCPVCGQSVKGQLGNLEEELEDIKSKQIELKSQKDEIVKEKSKIEEKFEILQSNIEKRKNKIKEELKNIEDKLVFYERDKEKYDKLVEQQNDIEKDLLAVKERIRTLAEENEVIEMMLALIKSNAITHKYLTSFLLLLNHISNMTGLDVQIFASEIKGKIVFRFEDDGVEKTLNSLSSGEKTRVALVVLFAIFETLQLFTQNKLNILVLDELLGVLDEQGIEMLKTLLEQYRQQMSVFVVLHHNEIEKEFFDLYIKVDKQNGLTQIEVDKVE